MIIHDVFTLAEIKKLQDCCNAQPIARVENINIISKEIAFHHHLSPFRKIIKPKIDKLIASDYTVDTSAYKECAMPYSLHVDSYHYQKKCSTYQFSDGTVVHDRAILIPLVDGKDFRTTIFDIKCESHFDFGTPLPAEWLTSTNNLNLNNYKHIPEYQRRDLNKLPLNGEYEWKLGSVITWDRSQLHCSTDFSELNFIKKMIVIFIA